MGCINLKSNKIKVVHMVTIANSTGLMKGQLSYLNEAGYEMTVISSPGDSLDKLKETEKVKVKSIKMERGISLFKDIISLIRIILYFIKIKPSVCNAGTPKAGLLGMIAAKITGVPFRVYTIRGLPYEVESGVKRRVLIVTEKIACFCANKIICISPSLKNEVINSNLTSKEKVVVFGKGSSNGLQLEKYSDIGKIKVEANNINKANDFEKYNFIIGYVGRINRSKGIKELVNTFESLQNKDNKIALLIVGRIEEKDSISEDILNKIKNNPNIIYIPPVPDPIPYYYIMDILVFPTHREGFGNVSIEAQAIGTPVITTNATGAVDTVIDNETGFIVPVRDEKALKIKIEEFINKPELVNTMSKMALERVHRDYDSKVIWENIQKLYSNNVKKEYSSSL